MNAVEYTQTDIDKAAKLMARMMPYMLQGMTFAEAGQAVIVRDEELLKAATGKDEQGQTIRTELAAQVYAEIRK